MLLTADRQDWAFILSRYFLCLCLKTGFRQIHVSWQFDKNHDKIIMLFRPATIPILISWKKILTVVLTMHWNITNQEVKYTRQVFCYDITYLQLFCKIIIRSDQSSTTTPVGILLFKSQLWKHQNKVWSLFKVNKDFRTTSVTLFWCLYY